LAQKSGTFLCTIWYSTEQWQRRGQSSSNLTATPKPQWTMAYVIISLVNNSVQLCGRGSRPPVVGFWHRPITRRNFLKTWTYNPGYWCIFGQKMATFTLIRKYTVKEPSIYAWKSAGSNNIPCLCLCQLTPMTPYFHGLSMTGELLLGKFVSCRLTEQSILVYHVECLCCLALRHSPSKRKSIVDRQKSLVGGNSAFLSHDVTNVSEVDADRGKCYKMLGDYSWNYTTWSCGLVQLTCVT